MTELNGLIKELFLNNEIIFSCSKDVTREFEKFLTDNNIEWNLKRSEFFNGRIGARSYYNVIGYKPLEICELVKDPGKPRSEICAKEVVFCIIAKSIDDKITPNGSFIWDNINGFYQDRLI